MPESQIVLEDLLEEPGFQLNSEGGIDTDGVKNRRIKGNFKLKHQGNIIGKACERQSKFEGRQSQ